MARATAQIENIRAPFSCQSRRCSGQERVWRKLVEWFVVVVGRFPRIEDGGGSVEDDSQGKVRRIKSLIEGGALEILSTTVHVPMRPTMAFASG